MESRGVWCVNLDQPSRPEGLSREAVWRHSCLHPACAASDTARFAASVAHTQYSENMRIPQEPLAEAANRELWSLHDAARAESECDSLVASESGDVCCEREQILVFQNLSDAQKMALCGDWHSAEAGTRVVAAATVFGAATRDHVFNILERLSQDSLAIVASYVAVVDLRLIVSHSSDGIPDRLPRWDDNFRRSQAFMRAFGSQHCRPEGHPLRWYIRTQPIETTWVVLFYTSHLDLGAMIRLASVSKRMVKPMARVTQHLPVVNVRHIPHISCLYNTNFEWIKSTRPDTYDHNYIYEGVGLESMPFRL